MKYVHVHYRCGRRHSNGFDRVNAHKRTGSGPVLVQFIASGRIWMHREFVIMRPRGITRFEYVHSSLPTFRQLTIKEVEVD